MPDGSTAYTRDGSFRLDSTRLAATLERDPAGAAAMFTTGLFGVYATIDKIARSAAVAGDPGSLAGSIATLEKVTLNGAEQWITIRGRDASKPILLNLGMGGPGGGGRGR